jgi:DNA modification methylase
VLRSFGDQNAQIFQGDCLNVLPSIADESIDLIFADPPYNIGKNSAHSKTPGHPTKLTLNGVTHGLRCA